MIGGQRLQRKALLIGHVLLITANPCFSFLSLQSTQNNGRAHIFSPLPSRMGLNVSMLLSSSQNLNDAESISH